MIQPIPEQRRPGREDVDVRWWSVGVARIAVLALAVAGVYLLEHADRSTAHFLLAFYAFGLAASGYLLVRIRRAFPVPSVLIWAQALVDFAVVAATVSFTGGPGSVFTFLFVAVILEAGLYLGVKSGFVFAALASITMAIQAGISPVDDAGLSNMGLAYNFLVQCLAFFLTAAMSGFWNMRLHRMQQFQREILDNMNNGFLITDKEGVVVAQNKAADTLLDIPKGSAIGHSVQDVLRVDSGEECPVLTAIRSERDFTSYEFHARTFSGAKKLMGLTTSRIRDIRGQLTGIIASFSDLTEMAEMRKELQKQDRLAVVGELAAGLAHEIRNPVAAIRGAVDELRSQVGEDPLAGKLAGIAIRESDHLDEIVRGFLDFAREPNVQREPLDVRALAEEVCQDCERRFGENGATYHFELQTPDGAVMTFGDRTQLKQVFQNIAHNGLEAMENGGKLNVSVAQNQSSIEVRFDDEGPGIEPDMVARIFEPFYTTKDTGVGMGLAVCHRIITAHDGTIRVSSRELGGTSLSVRLPAVRG